MVMADDHLYLYLRGLAAADYARSRGGPGMEFDAFGRQLGRDLYLANSRYGLSYLLTPVNIVRYWEFPFTAKWIPDFGRFLDVGSPRLIDLFVARRAPRAEVTVLNPDARDLEQTRAIARAAGITNIACEAAGADWLADHPGAFDCIWSISVIEHIHGTYTEGTALKWMYQALKPGGRLIVTFPVDRRHVIEYSDKDYYGNQERLANGKYFFYRRYDEPAIEERLIASLGRQPSAVGWFGETTPGRYLEYEKRWIAQGHAVTVEDPREVVDHYREYPDWESMPGLGICGMVFSKE